MYRETIELHLLCIDCTDASTAHVALRVEGSEEGRERVRGDRNCRSYFGRGRRYSLHT
jgi:hypothetical protein